MQGAKVTVLRDVHCNKAIAPILVTVLGKAMLSMPEHKAKAPSPMLVTPLGSVMPVRPEQP